MSLHLVNCKHGGIAGTSTGDDDDRDDDGILTDVEASSRTETGKTTERRRNPSLVSLAMGRTASKPDGVSTMDSKELIQGLYKGVLLDDDEVKFWIDENFHENYFMVLAKGLSIAWSDNKTYWTWSTHQEDCFRGTVDIDVPQLNYVWWLDISGKLPSIMLSPKTKYEAVIMLKMTEDADGWDSPVNLGLSLPNKDKTTSNRTEDLGKMPKGRWLVIPLGEFEAAPENNGYIEFFLNEHSTGHTKQGLIVRGVIFRPKSKQ